MTRAAALARAPEAAPTDVAPAVEAARSQSRSAWRADALCLAAAFFPVLASAVWKAFVRPRPFWAFFYDPETFYFHDGLRLLHGRAPLDVTHPGTPVQALSALVATVTGSAGLAPGQLDRFRAAAYCLSWGLQLLGAVALLRTVLARVPATLRIAVLVTYFLAAKSLEYETVWSPELLYFPAGALALAALWRALERGFDRPSSLWAGAAVGLACAVKFLFLPWLLAVGLTAVAVGGRGVQRLRALAGVAAGAALGFVVATLPAAGRYPDMLAWVARLTGHSGHYGSSPRVMPDVPTLIANLGELVAGAKAWYVWLALAAVGACLALRRGGGSEEARRLRGLALFCVTAIAVGHAIVLRAPDSHYLLPAAVAAAGLAAVAARAPRLRAGGAAGAAVLLVAALLLGKHLLADARTHLARNDGAAQARSALTAAVARRAPAQRQPIAVYGYGTPVPSLALRYFATDPELLRTAEALYPAEGHLGPGDRLVLPAGALAWDVMVLAPRDRHRVGHVLGGTVVERIGGWEVLVPTGRAGIPH